MSQDTHLTSVRLSAESLHRLSVHMADVSYRVGNTVHKRTLFQWLLDRYLQDPELQAAFQASLRK